MKVYHKRKGLNIKRKKSDIVVEVVNASLCFELDFKGVDYEVE